MITLAEFSFLVIRSVTATPHIISSVPSSTSILILSLPFFVMPFLYGDNLYYYVIQPLRFFWSHASNKTTYHHHVKLRGSFCLQMGGAAPPPTPPPRFLKAMDACKRKQESSSPPSTLAPQKQASGRRRVDHSCCTRGKSTRVILFANWGGLRPPQPPRFLKAMDACKKKSRSWPASMLAKNKHQVVAVWIIHVLHLGKATWVILFANGGGCAPPNPPAFKGRRCLKLLLFHFFIVFRDLSLVLIIPCLCIMLEPS